MTNIGILLKSGARYYFFCASCVATYFTPETCKKHRWTTFPVYLEQFPEHFGQYCHADGCARNLKDGEPLYKTGEQLGELLQVVLYDGRE